LIVDSRKVLDMIGKVHGISERGFQVVYDHVIRSLVRESNQELHDLTGRQF
jgi:hypothetical protein